MALNEDNFKANLRTASNMAAAQLGVDPSNLTFDQRRLYNAKLASIILKYPQSFSAQSVSTANYVLNNPVSDLEDTSISWGDFGNAIVDQAKITLPAIGNKLLIAGTILAAIGIVAYLVIHNSD